MAYLSPGHLPNRIFVGQEDAADSAGSSTLENGPGSDQQHLTSRINSLLKALAIYNNENDFDNASGEHIERALTDTNDRAGHYFHRLIKSALDKILDEERRQRLFDSAVALLDGVFQHQVEGRPLYEKWTECEMYIQHAKHLANLYNNSQTTKPPLKALSRLLELLTLHLYLLEIGEKKDALDLATITINASRNNDRLLYAHVANTAGCVYFELNDLKQARPYLEKALEIRRRIDTWEEYADTEEEYANTLGNVANLQSAEGHLDEALTTFRQCKAIRQKLGEQAIIGLAFAHLGMGRVYIAKGDYTQAQENYKLAKDIVLGRFGPEGHFIADVHYAFGNLERASGNLDDAEKHYTDGMLALDVLGMKSHVFNASFKYKLAGIAMEKGELQLAKARLDVALAIAEHHKKDSTGDYVRIIYLQTILLKRMGADKDDAVLAEKEAIAGQGRAEIERENLPPFPGGLYVDEIGIRCTIEWDIPRWCGVG